MLRQLILNVPYKVCGPDGGRTFKPQRVEGKTVFVELTESGLTGVTSAPILSDPEWKSIDFAEAPPLLEGRQYLVLVAGHWAIATWCVSRTRTDLPTQYYFSAAGVPFGALIEKFVLVPTPEESDLWLTVSVHDCLPKPGQAVLHVDKGERLARLSVYSRHESRRYQNLNGLCFGPDNPAPAVKKWMPVQSLMAG